MMKSNDYIKRQEKKVKPKAKKDKDWCLISYYKGGLFRPAKSWHWKQWHHTQKDAEKAAKELKKKMAKPTWRRFFINYKVVHRKDIPSLQL
jgi:hypothetical protein